jgi:macrolide transport system ATP-binding/permease protein
MQDAKELARIAEISRVSPAVAGRGQAVYRDKNWNTLVLGTGTEYPAIRSAIPVSGRFFSEDEVRERSKVAVIGSTVARELFGNENPVGRTFKINRVNFRVLGILPTKGPSFRTDQDDIVIIPITTAMYRLLGKDYVNYIDIQVARQEKIEAAKQSILKLLEKRHRPSSPGEEEPFEIRDLSEIREVLSSTTRTMSLLLGIVAAISLLVGGIGIMNIMLVSVKERVKEIGLRKAVGARKKDIRLQFLIESALLTLSGGVSGILLGTGISMLITLMAGWSVNISAFSIILSSAVSVVIGIAFGFWPAVQASRLNPVEALRYE